MVLEEQEEEQQYALCLNMIVKNESHIIKDTLIKLLQKIKFDYWVISDTGSTDETREIITDFFKEVGIPGELYEDEWVDFADNRNKALQHAFGKSKYLLVFDADDEICGDFVLPELTRDSYSLQFGSYTRTQIVNSHKRWKYFGVLHEYICSDDSTIDDASTEIIKGPYHVISGRTGNRNLDTNKYLKDAIILEKAYYVALNAKDNIYIRYGFYCANSYYDCQKYESAISWYKKTLENCGWSQEKYVSCLKLYNCYNNMGNKEAGFFYLVKSAEYDRERAECYYELIKYYSGSGLHDVAYGYYGVLRDFYNKSYLKTGLNNKLFIDVNISDFFLPYYVIIISDKMRDYETGIQMYRIIFTKKCNIFDEWYIGNLLYNLQFFIERIDEEEDKTAFYLLFQEYINFLLANNFPIYKHYGLMNKYKKYGIVAKEWASVLGLNGSPKSKFKILNLILFSNENISRFRESYLKMIQIQKEYIKSYSGNNITFYFYCYKEDLEEEYIIEENMIYIKGVESYVPGILQKTMKAFEITKNMEYDFLLRSNISTVIDYSKLNEVLHEIPDNVIYAGGSCRLLTWLDHDYGVNKVYNIPLVFGTSIILKKEGVDKLIENKFLLDETIIDDVAFGIFFNSFGDKPYGFDSYYRWNLNCMTNGVIFYRNRVSFEKENGNRTIEVDNITNVIQQIIEREQRYIGEVK
jgi:hypothetical protein